MPLRKIVAEFDGHSDHLEQVRNSSELLKAISHETRLLILCVLSKGERSVSELESLLSMPQATVSQQLARLRYDRLVSTRRDGRMIHYSIANQHVSNLVSALHTLFCNSANSSPDTAASEEAL